MNSINVVMGDNFNDVNKAVIGKIVPSDLSFRNIIVVPDRYSLLTEKMMFSVLNVDCVVNVSVMGVSKLASLVFEKAGVEFEFVNKQNSLLLVRKALQNLKNELVCYKGKISSGVCSEIMNTISQLKSNQIEGLQIAESYKGNDLLSKNKLADIGKILKEYQHLLGNKKDSTDVLMELENYISKVDLSNLNFFYVNFDSLTKQGFGVLKELAKVANSVFVGVVKAGEQKNAYIFENDMFEKVKQIAEDNNYYIAVETIENSLNECQNILHKNMFALETTSTDKDFVKVFEGQSRDDEIKLVAKEIKRILFEEKINFNKICVACGNLEKYSAEVERIFNDFNFDFYIDSNVKLSQTQPIIYLMNILKLFSGEYVGDIICSIISSEYNRLEENEKYKLIDFVRKYNIESSLIFDEFDNAEINEIVSKLFKNLKNLQNNALKTQKIEKYCEFFEKIIENIEIIDINNKKVEELKEQNFIKIEKIYSQIFPKLFDLVALIKNTIGQEECSFQEFYDILQGTIDEVELSTVPVGLNCIFVGDATVSFFADCDYLFVLGANEKDLPRYLSDNGIISDKLIDEISNQAEISPTVKMINRRNRFKIFTLLLNARKKLFLSYTIMSDDGKKSMPSGAVECLEGIFVNYEKQTSLNEFDFLLNKNVNNIEDETKMFAIHCGTKNNALHQILKSNYLNLPASETVLNSAFKVVGNNQILFDENNAEKYNIQNTEKLFFEKGTTSSSQMENYYKCPFLQFASNGIKLRRQESAVMDGSDVGQFLHYVAQQFLEPRNNNIKKINKKLQKIDEIVEKILKNAEKNDKFYKISLHINKFAKNIIHEESLRLCNYLYQTQLISKFHPFKLEYKFQGDNKNCYVTINDKNFLIKGVADRVDVCDDMFIVIDYKSGKDVSSSADRLYYGEKIQIFLYMSILESILNKKCYGIYYFPIHNKFTKKDQEGYKLQGRSVYSEEFLKRMDTSLCEEKMSSDLFTCSLSSSAMKNGEKKYNQGFMLDKDTFFKMGQYSQEIVKQAIWEILQGNIKPSPLGDSCKSCVFKSLCGFDFGKGSRKKDKDIKDEDFKKMTFDNSDKSLDIEHCETEMENKTEKMSVLVCGLDCFVDRKNKKIVEEDLQENNKIYEKNSKKCEKNSKKCEKNAKNNEKVIKNDYIFENVTVEDEDE